MGAKEFADSKAGGVHHELAKLVGEWEGQSHITPTGEEAKAVEIDYRRKQK